MCIAILQKANNFISPKTIEQCSKNNNDGFGIAYIKYEKVIVQKTIIKEQFITWLDGLRVDKDACSKPIMIHFRAGTSGSHNDENCHPFAITEDLAFCHNGVFQKTPGDNKHSDTWNFNETYLKPLVNNGIDIINDSRAQSMLNILIDHNKTCFLHASGKYIFLGSNTWIEDNNIYYSNNGYKQYTYSTRGITNIYTDIHKCLCCHNFILKEERCVIDLPEMNRYFCIKCMKNGTISVKTLINKCLNSTSGQEIDILK